jgi:hypothetical protein
LIWNRRRRARSDGPHGQLASRLVGKLGRKTRSAMAPTFVTRIFIPTILAFRVAAPMIECQRISERSVNRFPPRIL